METNIKIIRAGDFIRANPSGKVDLIQSKKLLGQIAELAKKSENYDILLDIREAWSIAT